MGTYGNAAAQAYGENQVLSSQVMIQDGNAYKVIPLGVV